MTVSEKIIHDERHSIVHLGAQAVYGHEEKLRGAVFTRVSVVEFMLDLLGYTPDRPLHQMRLLEPAFGGGRFVLCAVDRLIDAWTRSGGSDPLQLKDALCCIELDDETFCRFKASLELHLIKRGIEPNEVQVLIASWLRKDDFLLAENLGSFDFIVGNPPYVRQERIDSNLLEIYRKRYQTMIGRADLYICFMEHSLDLLSDKGKLCFICADAWTKNNYGRAMRKKISEGYALTCYVDMYGLDAFDVTVGAYPSVTVIERVEHAKTVVSRARNVEANYLNELAKRLIKAQPTSSEILQIKAVRGEAPWLLSAGPSIPIINELEANFPTLVEAGCSVGIGVATGADKIYVGTYETLDVEDDRKIPLATNKDIFGGVLNWTGKGVVNPWRKEGGLVDLCDYPRLASYLEQYRDRLSNRHTARGNVERNWYKTIDRITPELRGKPKLLIPDIKGNGDSIAYDPGTLYPHHSLYFITSTSWDLQALQAVLRSGIAHLFVSAYCVKIGGGFLRFQAQNLKRIRIPYWNTLDPRDQEQMQKAGESGDKLSLRLLEHIYQLRPGALAFMKEE